MPRRERPATDEEPGASAKEILEATLPLVVKAVADAATAMAQASSSMASLEGEVSSMKAEVASLKTEVANLKTTVGQLKKVEGTALKEKAEEAKAWRETFKAIFTPQVLTSIVMQAIVTILTGLGLWTVLPNPPQTSNGSSPDPTEETRPVP